MCSASRVSIERRARYGRLAGLVLAAAPLTPCLAADLQLPNPIIPGHRNLFSEIRVGASAQDINGRESGAASLAGEILFSKPFTAADLFTSYFVPRPHVGGSVATEGGTSFAYAGLTWSVDLTSWLFVEGGVGGAVHNGNTSTNLAQVPNDQAALGCSPLFRESGAVGVRLSTNWSFVATLEHLTNGGMCDQNRGLTNLGARLGYTF
jgi:lipid A 3-O-deacylase